MIDTLEVHELEQTAANGKRFQAIRKRFQKPQEAGATLAITPDGSLSDLSPAARYLLEYKSDQSIEPCFFSHVHGRNLYQVMRDVADMVCYGKSSASWLLRLRTGQGRWRWYKAVAKNHLSAGTGTIAVTLRDLHEF